jgi:hypothetical protein
MLMRVRCELRNWTRATHSINDSHGRLTPTIVCPSPALDLRMSQPMLGAACSIACDAWCGQLAAPSLIPPRDSRGRTGLVAPGRRCVIMRRQMVHADGFALSTIFSRSIDGPGVGTGATDIEDGRARSPGADPFLRAAEGAVQGRGHGPPVQHVTNLSPRAQSVCRLADNNCHGRLPVGLPAPQVPVRLLKPE